MKLKVLLNSVSAGSVIARIQDLYGVPEDGLPAYEELLQVLRGRETSEDSLSDDLRNMRICVDLMDHGTPDPYYATNGRNGTLCKEVILAGQEEVFGLSLTSWNDWLEMEVDAASLDRYGQDDVVAHVLWEISYHGFEESEMEAVRDELHRRIEEVNEALRTGDTSKFTPLEEVRKRIEDKLGGFGQD